MRKRKRKKDKRKLRTKKSLEFPRMRKEFNGSDTCKMLLTKIPEDLRDRFKSWCSLRGYTMTGKIRQFMVDCVSGKHEVSIRSEDEVDDDDE